MGRWEILMVGPSSRSAADREPDCSREAGPLQVGRATLPRVRISLLRTRELVRHSLGGVGSASLRKRFRQAGVSLVELSVALFLLTAVAVFGFQTMMSGWMLQNSSIMQSMTDAYAGIETAYAQRWTFANIPTSGRWPVYPASTSTVVTIGKTPKRPVNATVVRTSHPYTDPLTLAQSYMLESYVVYKDELRQYCKVSKVYRTE